MAADVPLGHQEEVWTETCFSLASNTFQLALEASLATLVCRTIGNTAYPGRISAISACCNVAMACNVSKNELESKRGRGGSEKGKERDLILDMLDLFRSPNFSLAEKYDGK